MTSTTQNVGSAPLGGNATANASTSSSTKLGRCEFLIRSLVPAVAAAYLGLVFSVPIVVRSSTDFGIVSGRALIFLLLWLATILFLVPALLERRGIEGKTSKKTYTLVSAAVLATAVASLVFPLTSFALMIAMLCYLTVQGLRPSPSTLRPMQPRKVATAFTQSGVSVLKCLLVVPFLAVAWSDNYLLGAAAFWGAVLSVAEMICSKRAKERHKVSTVVLSVLLPFVTAGSVYLALWEREVALESKQTTTSLETPAPTAVEIHNAVVDVINQDRSPAQSQERLLAVGQRWAEAAKMHTDRAFAWEYKCESESLRRVSSFLLVSSKFIQGSATQREMKSAEQDSRDAGSCRMSSINATTKARLERLLTSMNLRAVIGRPVRCKGNAC